MKKIKLSTNELLAVINNNYHELETVFEMFPKEGRPSKFTELSNRVITDLQAILAAYGVDVNSSAYEAFFKNEKAVKSAK